MEYYPKRKITNENTLYKKSLVLGLNKGRCKFTTSDFPSENPRMQTRNHSYTKTLVVI
ncbi:hypothetical protein LX92_04034 [Maribacter polysiphoniae]|uniref:Uncharacterized protein n=1 Tax=Maribacter polysiphoniae TaxID=429344 RepID=A0A316DXA2_9FLAO|nr:hypothetical protein LX92_04034 [Maribacter polysiphoniae]